MRTTGITSISYKLGEQELEYQDASGFNEITERERMPAMPQLWGWGSFYASENIFNLAIDAAQEALDQAQLTGDKIDYVLFSSSDTRIGFMELNQGLGTTLSSVQLASAEHLGVSMLGCVSTLAAIQQASVLVANGVAENVLVIAFEQRPVDLLRFSAYAVFSDAAAAAVISAKADTGWKILSYQRNSSTEQMQHGKKLDSNTQTAVKNAVPEALSAAGVQVERVRCVFSNSIFLPLKVVKETSWGFSKDKLFTENVVRTGHCFGCDSLINLLDHDKINTVNTGEYLVLHADAEGHDAAFVVQKN